MGQGNTVFADRLYLGIAFMSRCSIGRGRLGCIVQACFHAFETGFRVNQELRRHNHPLPSLQTALDLGLPVALDTGFNLDRTELAIVLGQHHHHTFTRLDHCFSGNQQGFFCPHVHELHIDQHAGY